MITVLMYHAIPPGDARVVPEADPHYSVSMPVFEQQIALMQSLGLRPSSVADVMRDPARPAAGVTFDDGHVTNLAAAQALHAVGGSADFFVNPSTVGTPGYLSWQQLGQMAEWGMSIQSHGMHHRFLDDLSPPEVEAELADSKRAIEAQLGGRVTIYAPAGGRLAPGTAALAQRLGYVRLCSSRVGLWNESAAAVEVPRMAMLATTPLTQLTQWLRQSPWEMGRQQLRYHALRQAKRALGNGLYVRLRQRLLGTGH